ncbi:MAG: PP2C family protein-serine/threonine phosphatase, partial [Flavobacteriales bacterium]
LKQQRVVRTALIIGILVVAGFLVFVFNRLRVIRKQKKEIETEKKIREEQHLLLEEKNNEIIDSINYAWRIQHGMIPTEGKVTEIFPESFVLYMPKDKLSGDFYWVGKVSAKALGDLKIFAVADCTGHGIPGALVSITGINYIKLGEQQSNVNSPAQALDFVNKGFYDLFQENTNVNIRDGMDVAMGALQVNNLMLHYAAAKNPVIVIRKGELKELKGDKHPIGRFGPEEPIPFTDHQYQLEKGDMLYVFSDGYGDQFGGAKPGSTQTRKFKSGELRKLLLEIHNKPAIAQRTLLFARIEEWKGSQEQTDDITIIGIRV